MAYNIKDLINKALTITIKRKSIYETIGKQNCEIPAMDVLSKVLVKQLDKTFEYYKALEKEIGDELFEEIDFGTYDKLSFLTNEYAKKLYVPEIQNTKQFFEFYINLERDLYALLIDIQGRFVKDTNDTNKSAYKILSAMIENKSKHIKTIEKTLK